MKRKELRLGGVYAADGRGYTVFLKVIRYEGIEITALNLSTGTTCELDSLDVARLRPLTPREEETWGAGDVQSVNPFA